MNVEVKYTYRDLLSTPDDRRRYELFEGELVMTPAPSERHQKTVTQLSALLLQYVQQHKLGRVYVAPLDVFLDEETVVRPDILFVSRERMHMIDEWKVNGALDLVVEVLSSATEERDRSFKFKRYAQEGVKEYWIADPLKKVLEVYTLGSKGFGLYGKYDENKQVCSSVFPQLDFAVFELWE